MRGSVRGSGSAATWSPEELDASYPALDEPVAPDPDVAEVPDEPAAPEPDAAERAEAELRAQIENAYQRGYDDGRAEGVAVEASRVGSALQALEQVVEKFEDGRPQWMDAAERNLVALATAIAREILGRELQGSADDITGLVQRAISEFPLEAAVRVRLNPADLSVISSPLRGDVLQTGREVRWIPDPSIASGGCMVEGPDTIVDGRVEKALERVYTELVYG